MKPIHFFAAMAPAVTAPPAAAQTQAPGLWEHAFGMKSAGGEIEKAMAEMKKQLDGMPPDQRQPMEQRMEQAMASRGVQRGAQGSSVKFRLTKEQAARPAEPRVDENCTQQVEQRSGNSVRFEFECTRPEGSSGEGEMTYLNDKACTGKAHQTAQIKGKPQQMSMEMTGKWLGPDCGDVKPRTMAAK